MGEVTEPHGRITGFLSLSRVAGVAALALLFAGGGAPATEARPNVLFVIVDDLRPELGCYGNTEIRTPHPWR